MTTTISENPSSDLGGNKRLTVVLADESYGLALLKVHEIVRQQSITTVPNMPDFVRGVIKLHGHVVPIVDLRVKFGDDAQADGRSCIVVVGVTNSGRGEVQIGLIVDTVKEPINLDDKRVAPSAGFSPTSQTSQFLGTKRVRERVKALLNMDGALSMDALGGMEAIS